MNSPVSPSETIAKAMEGKNRVQGMVRSIDQYRNCDPKAIADGSYAQVLYAHPPRSLSNEGEEIERVSTEAAMNQWECSLKRPDLSEKDRVRGAIETYKRQAFAFTLALSTRKGSAGDGSATTTKGISDV